MSDATEFESDRFVLQGGEGARYTTPQAEDILIFDWTGTWIIKSLVRGTPSGVIEYKSSWMVLCDENMSDRVGDSWAFLSIVVSAMTSATGMQLEPLEYDEGVEKAKFIFKPYPEVP